MAGGRSKSTAGQFGSWGCSFYGLQGKEKSLGNTLLLSLACWGNSPKTKLAAWAAKQDVARFLVWLRQKRGNSSAMRINNSKAGLTSQELEDG